MFHCYLKGGTFGESIEKDLEDVVAKLDRDILYQTPITLILDFLSRFAKALARELAADEGVYYLATWLRRSNLEAYITLNLGNADVLDRFVAKADGLMLRTQPRGIVCHWVAGNVPTLSIFSLVQSILAKNANIIRVPEIALAGTLELLKVLGRVTVTNGNQALHGADVLKSIAVVHCPSQDVASNRELSMLADCRVVWGGKDAVNAIVKLDHREHCETIVFGPKYSFAVMDAEGVRAAPLQALVMDIITFQQEACSSPHVLFCENNAGRPRDAARNLARRLATAFDEVSQKFPKPVMAYSDVFNMRGRYWLDPEREIVCSTDLDWTILIDDELRLEEPVKYRTIFIKEVDSVMDVIALITNRVQTIGLSIENHDKKIQFCEAATRAGVARCVPFGTMNHYDTPWDGMLFIDRLVRWTALRD